MNVLVLNCGSSSLKFQLISIDHSEEQSPHATRLAYGAIERIGGLAIINLNSEATSALKSTRAIRDHRAAVELVIKWLCDPENGCKPGMNGSTVDAVGHRVVHGGEAFKHSAVITEEVIRGIEQCIDLAPLHNPANLKGIFAARERFGEAMPQVAVFDTSFHQTLSEVSYLYAIPYQYYRRHRIRRYGFHGTSHQYVMQRYCRIVGCLADRANVITIHLGNGCSMAAIRGGKSVDTSMGLTPLEGLVMGTRSGNVDPALPGFVASKEGLSGPEVESLLNKQSGLMGISGLTNDMRDLLAEINENGDRRARLAVELFCYRVRKYIGAYLAAMNGADAIVFTGGIGENSPTIRAQICGGLEWLGINVARERNERVVRHEGIISTDDSRLRVHVIPTDEELMIANETVARVRELTPPGRKGPSYQS
jgi:acetate kinase